MLAGALSAMMVLSLVAPTGAQAAAKYSLTQKSGLSTVKADKAYTYNVKGVKKTQYIKVTKTYKDVVVKKGSTTVKKATKIKGTGKTIALKVTCPDKVATYKNTLKVKVYNKKNNKLVKTLSKKATVKVTELKVLSVEKASTSGKYLVAYFNKALKDLKVADVTVRNKATNVMLGVENVTLSTDGKSATVSLVGDESATNGENSRNFFVINNVDYTFSVTQNGVTATTDFTVDAVYADATVTKTDAAKKTIWVYGDPLTVPSTVSVDYEEILGRTVTVWFDKNNEITKLVPTSEKVVYGSFATVVDTAKRVSYLVDQATGDKYYTYDNDNASSIYPTMLINRVDNDGEESYFYGAGATDKLVFDYAKLVLNKNNTIREIVGVKKWADRDARLVTKVEGNIVYTGKTELSLKDYTIVKEGKTIALTDVKENDVIFYNVAAKFAEVYTKSATGELTGVYSDSFAFGGKTYKLAGDRYAVAYVGGTKKAATAEYMESLKAGKEQITVYFDRTGMPVYVAGKPAEVKTSDIDIVLTENAKTYNQSLKNYIQLKGYNADTLAKTTFDIDVADLESITNADGVTFALGKVVDKDITAYNKKVTKIEAAAKFVGTDADTINVTIDDGTPTGTTTNISKFQYINAGKAIDTNRAATGLIDEMKKAEIVTVTLNDNNKVVGLSYADGENLASVDGDSNLTGKAFTNAYKSLNGYQVTSATPVYVVEKDGTVTMTEYGKFGRQIVNASSNKTDITIYPTSTGRVAVIVIDGSNLAGNDQNGESFKGVVVSYKKTSDGKNSAELVAVVGDEVKTYTAFKANMTEDLKLGDIVEITPNRDGSVINKLTKKTPDVIGEYAQANATAKMFTINGKDLAMASGTTTIVKIDNTNPADVKVTPISFAELEGTKNVVSASYFTGTTALADVVIVTTTSVEDYTTVTGISLTNAQNNSTVKADALTFDVKTGAGAVKAKYKDGHEAVVTGAVKWTISSQKDKNGSDLSSARYTVTEAGDVTWTDDSGDNDVIILTATYAGKTATYTLTITKKDH
ncbi:hypothetical protein SAMN02910358_02615 [Lachnospiraceae bacterium XBB1006]|nr:hypothetical protein SAMN02910358_02615 [Lachnospiraceae bacterium XBB1006]